jgi:HSP20 family protein
MSIDRRRTSGYVPLRDAINQLFEGSFITPQTMGGTTAFPPTDLYLTEDDVVIEMAVPGINPDDVNISVTGQKAQLFADEIWRGRFQRSFQLPIQVDAGKAEASYENGVLSLSLPKSEATKPRKIQVRAQHSSGQNDGQGTIETEKVSIAGGQPS